MNMLSGYLLTGSSATAHEGNKLFTNVYSISSKAEEDILESGTRNVCSKRESRNVEGLMHRGSCNVSLLSFLLSILMLFFYFFKKSPSVLKRTAKWKY